MRKLLGDVPPFLMKPLFDGNLNFPNLLCLAGETISGGGITLRTEIFIAMYCRETQDLSDFLQTHRAKQRPRPP